MKCSLTACLTVLAALALPLVSFPPIAAAAPPGWSVRFDAPDGPATAWMKKHGWEEQRGSADRWRIAGGALHVMQVEDSTTIGTERGFPIDAHAAPMLSFRFKVSEWPAKGDLRKKDKEDAALRVFVIFDRGGGLLSPPDTLGYAFASSNPVGAVITAERFDNVKYIPIATAAGYDRGFIEVRRDLVADYKAAFGRAPPKIKAIGVKSDGNNTDGRAAAQIEWITIGPR